VQALAPALLPHLDKPFAFFGHSMGALIVFELARHLRRQHRLSPIHIFVSGRRAPQVPLHGLPLHQLDEALFVAELRRLNGTPEPVLRDPEMMQLFMPMLRADFALSETYVYAEGDPLDCPVTAFGGLADALVSTGDLLSWRDQTRSSFSLRMIPGDHFYLNSARDTLLAKIAEDLEPFLRRAHGVDDAWDFP
jgi:medium-chain acyl-[acyl-carrier-protein] hydrolase